MNKKLIQKADQLWKVNKEESEYKKQEKLEEEIAKRTSKRLPSKLQEAPQSIIKKEKIDKYINKKLLVENDYDKDGKINFLDFVKIMKNNEEK